MVRLASLIVLIALAGCETTQGRLSEAKVTEAVAKMSIDLPDLPEACVAETGRAYPKAAEPWVVLQKRWEILADNRDRLSADCQKWWDDYRAAIAGAEKARAP
ncbi:hypothetical protein [Rhizobium halophytocola]|uniref:Uncharacterized protein n=1 Tax=Rhizobium halophytocola TaxID=735519 RepID=A0ABS4E2D4_9HYPH|nr:hypothetical protein [Rhizobium halophytocola]MBP1852100.1 hypothetical protein [Rhizobium halophytocola]